MSEKSKRSRRNRGPKRRGKNKSVSSNNSNSSSVEDISNNNNSIGGSAEDISSAGNTPNEIESNNNGVILNDDGVISNDDGATPNKINPIPNTYVVESPQESIKKKLNNSNKSKSLDDDRILSIIEVDSKLDELPIESNAIITEAESDVEWETTESLEKVEETQQESQEKLSPQKELDLRIFLESLNLTTQNNPTLTEIKPKQSSEPSENEVKIRKAQMRAALEQHCQAQMLRPRFLDIIDEEGSNDSGDSPNRNSFKFIDDLEDDVFLVDKKVKEPKEHFPKPRDFLARKKEARRLQECKLVGAKILEAEVEEGCGDWTIENIEKIGGAEIVYLEDSSDTSETNECDDIDPEVFMEERVDIKTPVIELNNAFDAKLMPDKESTNSEKINMQTGPESAFAANEELIESLENLLVNPPVAEACNEVIMLANEFVDELPIVTEVLNEKNEVLKSDSSLNRSSGSTFDSSEETDVKSEEYSRQDSSSSVCSSHSTAKYNPMTSSLTDIDALVHDDVANSPEPTKKEATLKHSEPNLCETVAGQPIRAPNSLKELCVDRIAGLEYGGTILSELATVSQSLGEFAKEALLEMRDLDSKREEMWECDVSPETPTVPVRHHSKLPPALHLEKTPPPVTPRQSSFKVLQEEPPWVGLQSQKDPSIVAYLSPSQKKQMDITKNYSEDEVGELIDMHSKYAERRCHDESANSEKMPTASNNNDDKMAVQVTGERAAPDTTNRLLAIIRDPAVNPKVQKEKAEDNQGKAEVAFDFMETLKTFEDMNRNLQSEHINKSWIKRDKESVEVSKKTVKAVTKPQIELENNNKSERIVKVTLEKEQAAKSNGTFDDPTRELERLLNKHNFLLSDPILETVPKHDFGSVKEVRKTYRRSSLPRELHDAQLEYILQKEKEIEEQIRQLEQERHVTNVKIHQESKISTSMNDQNFQAEKYRISRQGDVATYQSDVSKESMSKSNKIERPKLISEGEKFREQMYCEYMDKVAEREERKQHKVIKITNVPNGTTVYDIESDKNTLNEIRNTCNRIEEEFIIKAKERWDKMGFNDECNEEKAPKVIEHKIKVMTDDVEKEVDKLPSHLQEFVEFTSNGDESEPVMFAPTFKAKAPASGVWSPGAAPAKTEPSNKEAAPAVNGDTPPKSTQTSEGAPPPPPPPPPPVWTPRSKGSSPVAEKKEFRPVPFESPKLPRKVAQEQQQQNQAAPATEKSAPPPWEVRLAGSRSAPEAAGLSGLANQTPQTPPPPPPPQNLPRAQNPTITLLQKAREGQLPRGASYIEHDRDLPNDRRISPPRIQPGETVYSLRRGYMSEPESGNGKSRKMAELGPKKYEGIGPTTKDGMPITLRSEVKENNQSKWYKKMYDTIHKSKYDAHPSAVHTAPRSTQYAYFNPKSGYLSEPEGGAGAGGWNSDAYDSDVPQRRHSALDRRRAASDKENEINSPYMPSNKYSTLASAKASQEVYKNQPGRIEDYIPGRSSVIDKEAKQWWDEVMDIFDGQLANANQQQPPPSKPIPPSSISKSYMARALKESGYESDSTLVLRRREGSLDAQLSPQEQKLAYRSLQAGGEPPLQGFRKPAPDKPKDDTEIEYFPLSPTLTRIRVHKNADRGNDIICYPLTSLTTDNPFYKYQQTIPSFISVDFQRTKFDPPPPPKRLSSKANSTLKLVSSITPTSRLLQTRNDISPQKKLSSSGTITKNKKEVRETKMKSLDGKRIRTTRTTISVPVKINKASSMRKSTESIKGTSSFCSPRHTMSPVDYATPLITRYFPDNSSNIREIIEGGAGRKTPITGVLDRGTSLDRTFASEKKTLPLKSIQEFPTKLSKSTEALSPTDSSKSNKENKKIIKKSTSCSSVKSVKNTEDKNKAPSSPRGRELMRTSDKLNLSKLKSTEIQNEKVCSFHQFVQPKKSVKSSSRTRKSLDDLTSKVKSSNSSLNSIKSSKCNHKSIKGTDRFKVSAINDQFGDFKNEKSTTKTINKKQKSESNNKFGTYTKSKPKPKTQDKDTVKYLKSINREIDDYVTKYEKTFCSNLSEINNQRDAIMSDSFFQHLLLRDVPHQSQVDYDPDFHCTSVLEKAKFFQSVQENPTQSMNRHVNSYLNNKKAVTDSKFRSWDRYEARPRSPRAVSWPGRMSQSCIRKFDSLSQKPSMIPKLQNRSKSEPPKVESPIPKIAPPFYYKSPNKIIYQRTQSPPTKIVFTQTSRPLSPIIIRKKVTGVSPQMKQTVKDRSRSESPLVQRKSDLNYYSDSEPIKKRSSPDLNVRKMREESPSPSPMRSPSCRRIHNARIAQCRADDCINKLKKKVIRTQSAGEAESRQRENEDAFVRSNSFLNLSHMRDHLKYQEYITELKHKRGKCDRFKELNRFYSYLERIGELERATSVSDLRPRRRDEEIIDFERWKRVRALEKAEDELNRLYKKMKIEQQEKDLLFLPHDAESLKWCQNKDWNLRSREKSVEDLREHFSKLAEGEADNVRHSRRNSDVHNDTYKPLWRGNSVMNLASSLTKRNQSEVSEKLERISAKIKVEPTLTNIRERLGIGNRLWSSLSMEQVSALKSQLNNIYSKELEAKFKENANEDFVITVPNKEKPKNGLQVRCNSFTVGDVVNGMEPNKNTRADSISSIQHSSLDKDTKDSLNAYQNLSEKEKKHISMTISQEVLERVRQHKEKYSPVVLAKETMGATAAARIRGISKSQSGSSTPKTPQSFDIFQSDKSKDLDKQTFKIDEEIKKSLEDNKSLNERKTSLSPLRQSSASETETGSSDASNRTVIFRDVKDAVQKKVDFFEKSLQDTTSSGATIHHARDDSLEEKQDQGQVEEQQKPSTSHKLGHSQSFSSLKDLFGETHQTVYSSMSPVPKSEKTESKESNLISSTISSLENICRSRSLSPDPERYWRAYLSLVKAGEVQKLKMKFEDSENYSSLEESVPKLRRYQSDPEIIRTILQHNWEKRNGINVRRHERGEVDRLTHKYETSSRGRSRYRRHGVTSPILKSSLRVEDREMPHIDVISKIASLKVQATPSGPQAEYPVECPIGEVNRIKQRFEKDKEDTSLMGKMYTSTPDIHELRDIAPYLSGPWASHKYPKRQDNNRSLSTSDYISEDKYSPVRKDRPRPKSTSPIREKTHKPSSILKQQKKVDVFANQEFDPDKHRPKYRYEPPREEPPARPAFPQQLPAQSSRPTVTFRDPELAPIPPPKGIPIGRDYGLESPRRYVEGDVNIHYRVPVRQEPRPMVPEDELARRQAEHMRKVYQEERRRKYLQELQDMNSRRHTDNFTPSQKSPIALNRYDTFGTRQVARALFNFVGQGARELSFRKGDLILVRRQIDNNWYEGEYNNAVGLFPYNYVEMIQYDSTTTPSQRRPTEGRARAKFNFVAQTHLELGLRKGELVTLIRRVDENWYEGRLGDRKGIFPVSYVEVLTEPTFNRAELPPSIVSGKPMASPAAHSMVGAAGAASLGAHHYTPQLNSPALSNSPSSTAPLALPNHGITNHHARPASATLPRASDPTPINLNNHEPLYVDTNAEAVPYRAMYKYKPQNPDELELQEGETVYVLEKCDDGWYVGSSQRTGRFGTFPGNYVEKI